MKAANILRPDSPRRLVFKKRQPKSLCQRVDSAAAVRKIREALHRGTLKYAIFGRDRTD